MHAAQLADGSVAKADERRSSQAVRPCLNLTDVQETTSLCRTYATCGTVCMQPFQQRNLGLISAPSPMETDAVQ